MGNVLVLMVAQVLIRVFGLIYKLIIMFYHLIHVFQKNGRNLVLDINLGKVFTIFIFLIQMEGIQE